MHPMHDYRTLDLDAQPGGSDWLGQHTITQNIVGGTVAFCLLYFTVNDALKRLFPETFSEKPEYPPAISQITTSLRWRTAERVNGIVHASTTVSLCVIGLLQGWLAASPRDVLSPLQFQYDAANSPLLELSLTITIAYFIVDLIAMWANALVCGGSYPTDFTVHHAACMGYSGVCLYLGLGAQTAAVATIVGEVTNPLQNAWFISKDVPGLETTYAMLSPVFTYSFCFIRCILTPLWSVDVIYFCAMQPNAFQIWGPVFAFLCFGVNIGGVMWAKGLWMGYQKAQAKLRAAAAGKARDRTRSTNGPTARSDVSTGTDDGVGQGGAAEGGGGDDDGNLLKLD